MYKVSSEQMVEYEIYLKKYSNTMTKDKMSFYSIIANIHALIKVC